MTQELAAIAKSETDRKSGSLLGASLMFAVLIADQATKTLAVSRLQHEAVTAPGPFEFELVANSGAFLGLPVPTWLLVGIALIISVTAVQALTVKSPSGQVILGYGLLIGGAFGNLLDRIQDRPNFPRHAVVDWIATDAIPTFNLADVAIFLGVLVLLSPTRKSHALKKDNPQRSGYSAHRG